PHHTTAISVTAFQPPGNFSVPDKLDRTMKLSDLPNLPAFDDLPVKPGAPPESSWGVFGEGDDFGCLNFLTPDGVVQAARLVQTGKVFRLDAPIGFLRPPMFGRSQVAHRIVPLSPLA